MLNYLLYRDEVLSRIEGWKPEKGSPRRHVWEGLKHVLELRLEKADKIAALQSPRDAENYLRDLVVAFPEVQEYLLGE